MSDFFERMKEGFNRGVATVSAGSKTMIEKTKINVAIKNLEDEKNQLIETLGNNVYAFYTENEGWDIPRTEVAGICKEIIMREEQIKINKKKIEILEEEMSQIRNGSNSNTNTDTKCQCGYINSDEAKFCMKCGSKLK